MGSKNAQCILLLITTVFSVIFTEAFKTIVGDNETTSSWCPDTPTCGEGDWGRTKPYPPDCSKYIYCNSLGEELLKDCNPEEHFSVKNCTCLPESEADCELCDVLLTTTPEPPECPPNPECTLEEVGELKPVPGYCEHYIYCDELGEEEVRICPGGEHFSPEELHCMDPELAECQLCIPI